MKRFFSLLALILAISLTGCLETVYPFFNADDAYFEKELLGTWHYSKDKEKGSIRFERLPLSRRRELNGDIRAIAEKGYLVTYLDTLGKPGKTYFVFLARIGKEMFLDRYPADSHPELHIEPVFTAHYLKMHSCLNLHILDHNRIELKRVESSFLDELIDRNEIRIHYTKLPPPDSHRVITAPTSELSEFLKKYGSDPKAYNSRYSYTCYREINY